MKNEAAQPAPTPTARLNAIFQEINNNIFRQGHINVGLSAALTSSGSVFEFQWFKQNILKLRVSIGEDKELEAILVRDGIYIDYFADIHVYCNQIDNIKDFNSQRGRWTYVQLHSLINNIRYLPAALFSRRYDWVDKIVQWMMVPRTIMMGIISVMSIILPFIYFSLAIKWWIVAAVVMFAYSVATPDYMVTKNWDSDFLRAPFITVGGIMNIFRAGRDEAGNRLDAFSHLMRKLNPRKKKKQKK